MIDFPIFLQDLVAHRATKLLSGRYFFEMKGVARLRLVDVDATEVGGTTSRRRRSGAGALSAASDSSVSRPPSPHSTLASSALMALSLNSLRGFRQEHSSTIPIRTNSHHNMKFWSFTFPAAHGSRASAIAMRGLALTR